MLLLKKTEMNEYSFISVFLSQAAGHVKSFHPPHAADPKQAPAKPDLKALPKQLSAVDLGMSAWVLIFYDVC
jgi:hypothetical protein